MMIIIVIIILIVSILIIYNTPYPYLEFKRVISFLKSHKNNYISLPMKKLRIAIITAENRNEKYIELHDNSVNEYCNMHGYTYIRTDNCPKEQSSTYWCKIHKIRDSIDKYDYIIWLDSDTIIINKNIPIEYYLSKYGYPDIIFGKQSMPLDIARYVINAGIIIIKNSNVGKMFINDAINKINSLSECIVGQTEQGFWAGVCYEEGIMNILVKDDKYKNNVFIDMDYEFILHQMDVDVNIGDSIIFLHLPGYTNNKREKIFNYYK
jgi:hypothetical protein